MTSRSRGTAALLLTSLLLVACTGKPGGALANRCSRGVAAAYGELKLAKAQGFGGTVDWTKAASLLTAAKVQYQFERYPNCIDKVRRARVYIARSKRRR